MPSRPSIDDPEEQIEDLWAVQRAVFCTDIIDADIEEKEAELELLSGRFCNCVMMNASAFPVGTGIPSVVHGILPAV